MSSLFCCSKSRMSAAVNCLLTDPSQKWTSGVFATFHYTLACPKPLLSNT